MAWCGLSFLWKVSRCLEGCAGLGTESVRRQAFGGKEQQSRQSRGWGPTGPGREAAGRTFSRDPVLCLVMLPVDSRGFPVRPPCLWSPWRVSSLLALCRLRGLPNYTWGLLFLWPSALGKTIPSESPGGCSPKRVSCVCVRVCEYTQGLGGPAHSTGCSDGCPRASLLVGCSLSFRETWSSPVCNFLLRKRSSSFPPFLTVFSLFNCHSDTPLSLALEVCRRYSY